jgi:phosphoribosylformylglycinamidine synthase
MWGLPPYLDIAKEKQLQAVLIALASEKLVTSAKDCSEGGIATALAEMGFRKGVGAKAELISAGLALECVLFGEDASRVVVSCDPSRVARIQGIAGAHGIHAQQIGTTTSGIFEIRVDGASALSGAISDFRNVWAEALEASLKADVELVAH